MLCTLCTEQHVSAVVFVIMPTLTTLMTLRLMLLPPACRSLPALLQACAALLSPAPHARLRLESIVAFNRHSNRARGTLTAEQFIQACTGGLSARTHAALLGLRYSGSQLLPYSQKAIRMEWAATAAAAGQMQAGDSSSSAVSGGVLAAPALHSAASLFLDLKPPFKHFVETYAAEPALHTSSSSSSVEAWADWWSHGSPLTLVHLLALAAPTASVALLQALLRTAGRGGLQGPAALFKHELTLHAGELPQWAVSHQLTMYLAELARWACSGF